jgi:hypothetical protein
MSVLKEVFEKVQKLEQHQQNVLQQILQVKEVIQKAITESEESYFMKKSGLLPYIPSSHLDIYVFHTRLNYVLKPQDLQRIIDLLLPAVKPTTTQIAIQGLNTSTLALIKYLKETNVIQTAEKDPYDFFFRILRQDPALHNKIVTIYQMSSINLYAVDSTSEIQ